MLAAPLCARGQATWVEFRKYGRIPPNIYSGEAVLVDLDGDDFMDLVMSGRSEPSLFSPAGGVVGGIFTHATVLQFTAPGVIDTTYRYDLQPVFGTDWLSDAALAVSDIDNDGRPDVAVSGTNAASETMTNLIMQADSLVFVNYPQVLGGVEKGSLDWGDYNNDGRSDLLMTGTFIGAATMLYENQGGLSFQHIDLNLPDVTFGDAAWGDSDNDGDLDILITGARNNNDFISALFLNENGTFVEAEQNLPAVAFSRAKWTDLNSDGLLDIVLAGAQQTPFILSGRINVLLNRGDNTFEGVPNEIHGFFYGDLEVVDYDGDGRPDIGVSGLTEAAGTVPARFYVSESGRLEMVASVIHTEDIELAPGDYDRDGDVDWFVTGFNPEPLGLVTPTAAIYTNISQPPNAPPGAPSGLAASTVGDQVHLTWNPSTDDKTPSAGLTYNIRVGTTPNAVDTASPLADPVTGLRYVCDQGNVFHNTSWTLKNLPPGTYFWSVQAIDAGCRGSAFASEKTFTINDSATSVESPFVPTTGVDLRSAHPNPFTQSTTIDFAVLKAGHVRIGIYDVLGREVCILLDAAKPAGPVSIRWNGRDGGGAQVAPGTYLYRIESESGVATGSLVYVR